MASRSLPYTPELDAALDAIERQEQDDCTPDAERLRRWRAGDLSFKLLPHQRASYDSFKEWNAWRQTPEYAQHVVDVGAQFDDVFVDYSGRRVGKTAEKILLLTEIALTRQDALLTYFTAFQTDIGSIIIPLANMLVMGRDCPVDCRPVLRPKHSVHGMCLQFREQGSYIKLVGVDKHPDSLRGQFSDGVVGSETSFIRSHALDGQGLEYIVRSVLLPQFQHRPWAFLILETSAPKDVDHPMITLFKPDAELRDACVERTLDDNTSLSKDEYDKAIRQSGGRGHIDCEREYFNVVQRDPISTLVPEFSEERHVVDEPDLPAYAHAYVGMDPGSRDHLAVVWAYWDFARAKLVVQRSFSRPNITTTPVSDLLRATELELWEHLRYWNGREAVKNPFRRVSDVDLRLIGDLAREHGIQFVPTAKDDPDAQLYALRNAFLADKIEIVRDSGPLAAQLMVARRNRSGNDWERSPVHGHFDAVAALVYLWRNVVQTANPNPDPRIRDRPAEQAWVPHDSRRVTNEQRAVERMTMPTGMKPWSRKGRTQWR